MISKVSISGKKGGTMKDRGKQVCQPQPWLTVYKLPGSNTNADQ